MRKENTMDELISRQVLLDKFEKWQKTEDYSNDEWNLLVDVLGVIKSMPSALGTNLAEVGTDCISRQAAIDTVNSRKTAEQCKEGEVRNWTVDACIDMIKQLPSAQPKIGRWIHDGSKWANRWICSECGYKWFFDCIEGAYCPNCGADMRGEQK